MAISSLGSGAVLPQSIVDLREKLTELQAQLGTGRKATTYGGLGSGRTLALGLRSEIARIESFSATIKTVDLRLGVVDNALVSALKVVDTVRGALLIAPYEVGSNGKSQVQYTAEANLSQLVQLYNSQLNGRYLFAGREAQTAPVANDSVILNGQGTRAGLKQVIDERRQADLGAGGLGRLDAPASVGAVATLAEDSATPHPFGFKLASVTSSLTGTTVAGPVGAPPAIDVTFSATLPLAGEQIAIGVTLPDGTTSEFRLTATSDASPGPGQFAIGTDEIDTAANFSAALSTEIARVASIDLSAASAVQAADEFFDFTATTPPQRVGGPPFNTATTLVDATTTNTVFWYEGDLTTPARQSAVGRIDERLTVDYGARADEPPLRHAIKNVALVAALRFDANVETDGLRYEALKQRIAPAMSEGAGQPSIREVAIDLSQKHAVVIATGKRHQEALAFAKLARDDNEGVNLEEVGVMFLRLQTQLQASYETTSILSRLTLVNFL